MIEYNYCIIIQELHLMMSQLSLNKHCNISH